MQENKGNTITGFVGGISGAKSISVYMECKVKHPKYGKYVRRRTTVAVHDPNNVAKVGDLVEVSECRPISKNKSWRLLKVVKKAAAE